MKFVDDGVKDELAKSSTVLQCILAILDYECNKYYAQPEVIDVEQNSAVISIEKMHLDQLIQVCGLVNSQFKRRDKKPTCAHIDAEDSIIYCEAVMLDQYDQLT